VILKDLLLYSTLLALRIETSMITTLLYLSLRTSLPHRKFMQAKRAQPLRCGAILRLYMKLLATPPLLTTSACYTNAT